MYKVENFAVYDQGLKIGYLQRQGEDGRMMDMEGERQHSFFPWEKALKWVKENRYQLKKIEDYPAFDDE